MARILAGHGGIVEHVSLSGRWNGWSGARKVLFVHGALVCDAAWWWSRMAEPLEQRGLDTAAVELPICEGNQANGLYTIATRFVSRSTRPPMT
jgi:hypothetical protein